MQTIQKYVNWLRCATQFVSKPECDVSFVVFVRVTVVYISRRIHLCIALSSPPSIPTFRPRRGRKVPFLFGLWNDFLSRFSSAQRGFIIYAMDYANYDKVQIFHMTCTCVTPLSTRDRLTKHVNRDALRCRCACMCTYTHTRRSKFW